MKRIAVYPGTFDPVTYGHIDLIKRALKVCDELILAVAHNPGKQPVFNVGERVIMLKQVTRNLSHVIVDDFSGLLVDYARKKKANMIIRGLRAISDFEYEFQMALTNRKLDDNIESIFMMPNEAYAYISSRIIKEIVRLGADVSCFVPKLVESKLRQKLL